MSDPRPIRIERYLKQLKESASKLTEVAMTRQHFIAIANLIKQLPSDIRADIASQFADFLATTNSAFNRQRFLDACNEDRQRHDIVFVSHGSTGPFRRHRTLDHGYSTECGYTNGVLGIEIHYDHDRDDVTDCPNCFPQSGKVVESKSRRGYKGRVSEEFKESYFPSVAEVVADLLNIQAEGPIDGDYMDVRLQVYPDWQWVIRTGDASYDLDHHGYWGAGEVSISDTREDLTALANDLIDQAMESLAQMGDMDESRILKAIESVARGASASKVVADLIGGRRK